MRKRVAFDFRQQLNRRCLLRGAGVAMAMPWLSAMRPAFGAASAGSPRRFVAMTLGLGLIADNLNPAEAGTGYEPSPYLAGLTDLRKAFTVVSGASHPDVRGEWQGHCNGMLARAWEGCVCSASARGWQTLVSLRVEPSHSRLCGFYVF